jgi:carbonic anhydrase
MKMVDEPHPLLVQNKTWAREVTRDHPKFFEDLKEGQQPDYMWIGCADSRVPATAVVDLGPGDIFVHRNVANLAVHTDFNMLGVLEYAVDYLEVEDIIICGHEKCGGVQAALSPNDYGILNKWLRNIKDVYALHSEVLDAIEDEDERLERFIRLNVATQVHHIAETSIIQKAWKRGQNIEVHGWVFSLATGEIEDLGVTISSADQLAPIYRLDV